MLSVGQLAAPPTPHLLAAQLQAAASSFPPPCPALSPARCTSWRGDVPVDVSELAYLEKL